MSRAQYAAILHIAEYGERFAPHDLNVTTRTMRGLFARGWVTLHKGRAVVTAAGWTAMEAAQ